MKKLTQKGAWVIVTNKVISQYNVDQPVFDPFEATINAGRAGELFSAIRALGRINGNKFNAYRKLYKLKRSVAENVLSMSKELGYLNISWDTSKPSNLVEELEFLENSKEAVYKLTGIVFDKLKPTKVEDAILEILSNTLLMPQTVGDIKTFLISKIGLNEKETEDTIKLAIALKLITQTEETEKGQKILFNPHAFEGNAADAFKVLDDLDFTKKQQAI